MAADIVTCTSRRFNITMKICATAFADTAARLRTAIVAQAPHPAMLAGASYGLMKWLNLSAVEPPPTNSGTFVFPPMIATLLILNTREEEEGVADGPIEHGDPIKLPFLAEDLLNQVQVVRAMCFVKSIISVRGISTLASRQATPGTHTDDCAGHARYCAGRPLGKSVAPLFQ